MEKKTKKILLILLIVLFIAGGFFYWKHRREQALYPELCGPYPVLFVYDGDTILIDLDGVGTRVRLIGIDAPESVHPDESKNTPEGAVSSAWLKDRLEVKKVWLAYDVEVTDSYGRTLAYVYEGGSMLQEEILSAGMATVYTIQPNSLHAGEFFLLQQEARKAGVGIWEKKN